MNPSPQQPAASLDESVAPPCSVAYGNWVALSYRLYDSEGEAVDEQARQLVYLHGIHADLFPKIEQSLEGLQAGAFIRLYLEPQDCFGDYNAEVVHLIDRKLLPADVEVGMAFEGLPGQDASATAVEGSEIQSAEVGDGIYTVTELAAGLAVLDGNHPLAGMSLRFDIEVMEIWEALPDEIEQARLGLSGGQEASALSR